MRSRVGDRRRCAARSICENVTIDVQPFDSIPGHEVVIDAVWTVRKAKGGETRSGRTVAREAVTDASFDALAAAYNRSLAAVSSHIAAAIRAEAAARS